MLLGLWSSQLSADWERRWARRLATGAPSRLNGGTSTRVGSAGDLKRLYWCWTCELIAVDVVILYADGVDGGKGGILLLLLLLQPIRPIVCVAVVIRLERNVAVMGAIDGGTGGAGAAPAAVVVDDSICFFFSAKLNKLLA